VPSSSQRRATNLVRIRSGSVKVKARITPLRAAEPVIKRYVIIGLDTAQQAKDRYASSDMKNINTYNEQHTKGRAFLVDAV
jgi:hypothetical protein